MINIFRKILALLGFSTLHFGKVEDVDNQALKKQNIPCEHRKHVNTEARKKSPDIQFSIVDFRAPEAKKVFFARRVIEISPRSHFRKKSPKRRPPS